MLALVGPTASGKSAVALRLAEELNAEIVSVDSMQVYRGMDFGTAKPSMQDRLRIPHHLIDVVEVTSPFDAAQFVSLARQAVQDIRERGRLPILCGGTGLYLKAFLDGLGRAPGSDAAVRVELESRPLGELLQELARRDPLTYERIDRQNARRVIRALEVIRITGEAYSLQRADWLKGQAEQHTAVIFGIERSATDIQRRIATRVDVMFKQGLVAETETLLKAGLAQNRTALQALGYRQVVEHLQGLRSLGDTIALVKTRTRQFAKRQMTWFRRQLPICWIRAEPTDSAGHVAAVLKDLSGDQDPKDQ